MRLLFELSGEHPDLPFSELECVGRVLEQATQVAIAEIPDPKTTERLALTHTVMEYLGSCPADLEAFAGLLEDLAIHTDRPFAGRAKKMHDSTIPGKQLDLERLIGTKIEGPVSLTAPQETYRVLCAGNRCFFGRVITTIDRGSFEYRNPMRRAFFHPGVMLPILARTLVNLSQAQENDTVLDPFCGTGGVLLEAETLGMRACGFDMDPAMIVGARENLPDAELGIADATALPLRDAFADAVVTDLPYGQSVCIRGDNMERLYHQSLKEIRRVLKQDHRAVVVTHKDIREIAAEYFDISDFFSQRVHKSLTRRIMVLT